MTKLMNISTLVRKMQSRLLIDPEAYDSVNSARVYQWRFFNDYPGR
jgi:hypothetical protein